MADVHGPTTDLQRGIDLAQQGHKEAAYAHLRRALYTEGDSGTLRLWLAATAPTTAELVQHLERAASIEPTNREIAASLAEMQSRLAAEGGTPPPGLQITPPPPPDPASTTLLAESLLPSWATHAAPDVIPGAAGSTQPHAVRTLLIRPRALGGPTPPGPAPARVPGPEDTMPALVTEEEAPPVPVPTEAPAVAVFPDARGALGGPPPVLEPQKPRRRGWVLPAVLALIILLLVLVGGGLLFAPNTLRGLVFAPPSATPPPAATVPPTAVAVIGAPATAPPTASPTSSAQITGVLTAAPAPPSATAPAALPSPVVTTAPPAAAPTSVPTSAPTSELTTEPTAPAAPPATSVAGPATAVPAPTGNYTDTVNSVLTGLRVADGQVANVLHQVDTGELALPDAQETVTSLASGTTDARARLNAPTVPAAAQAQQQQLLAALDLRAQALTYASQYLQKQVALAAAQQAQTDAQAAFQAAYAAYNRDNTDAEYAQVLATRQALDDATAQVARLQAAAEQDQQQFQTLWDQYHAALP